MTLTTVFLLLAAIMVIVACAVLMVPLLRHVGETSPVAAGAVVAVLPLSVVALYLAFSNWSWQAPAAVAASPELSPSVVEMVSKLEQRLQTQADDLEGWIMLGRSYVVIGRYAEAVDAYGEARRLSADADVNALSGQAEALAMSRGGVIEDDSAALLEKALRLSPDDRKALWYGGLSAYERGQPAIARERWQRLLQFNPPEQMVRLLNEQIATVDAVLGETAPPAVSPAAGINLRVTLDSTLRAKAPDNAPLFILARPVGGSGPPLAVVRRQVADLPLELLLSDADAMVPGLNLSAHDTVEVVARIALGGTPTAQQGDLYGSQVVAASGDAAIAINQVY